MKTKQTLFSVGYAISLCALLSSCHKSEDNLPKPTTTTTTSGTTVTCNPPAKPLDTYNLNLVGSASQILIPSAGALTPLTAVQVTATAYVLTEQGNLYTVNSNVGAASATSGLTNLQGQANYTFTAPARLTKEDVETILVQFTTTPLPGRGIFQATVEAGNTALLNSLNFTSSEVAATFDKKTCSWPASDVYTIGYSQPIILNLAPADRMGKRDPKVAELRARAKNIIQ